MRKKCAIPYEARKENQLKWIQCLWFWHDHESKTVYNTDQHRCNKLNLQYVSKTHSLMPYDNYDKDNYAIRGSIKIFSY